MSVSWSGTVTLVVLIGVGPLFYLGEWIYRKFIKGEVGQRDTSTEKIDGRETMSTKQYIFILLGYAIGIGNVWRFPYVIAQNGGAAAVVAYVICGVLVAVPLFLYESIAGQYTRLSTVQCYTAIRPRWQSFGYSQFFMLFLVQSYYVMIVGYTLPYIIGSCKSPLPWTADSSGAHGYWKDTVLGSFQDHEMANKPPGPGPIQWQLALSLLAVWVMTYFAIAFGKNLLAKITYVTVISPVVLLVILVIRTALLEGAENGIAFYIGKFEAAQLGKLEVWATACSQILFSLSPGFGTAITMASYTHPKEDVYRTCMIIAVANSTFSFIGGFAIFAMMGHVAYKEGLPVEDVATSGGTGLAFIAIAEAMPLFGQGQNVMSVLFFFMLLTLGLDSAFAWTETLVAYVEDIMMARGMEKLPTWKTTLGVCTSCFLMGLPFATRYGNQILDVVDHFVGSIFLLLLCFGEAVIFNLDFKWQRMAHALRMATFGNKRTPNGRSLFPKLLCRLDFHVTVPAMSLLLGVYLLYYDIVTPYGGYPMSLLGWGWGLLAFLIAIIPITLFNRAPGTLPPIEENVVVDSKENKFKGSTFDDSGASANDFQAEKLGAQV